MAKLGLFASLAAIVASLAIATLSPSTASADDDKCTRTTFQTEMVKNACKTSQKAAKDAMKKFNQEKKIKSCNLCHSSLSPKYELIAPKLPGEVGGLQRYKDLGGK